MELSIIVPVYNVEKYVERCLRSLENQNFESTKYEIIVVNDGSPDNSREVVLGLMQEFSNIVLVDQENKGVSMARNAGIDRARGNYLLFIDPDDYVERNALGQPIDYANQHQAQVVFLGYQFLNGDGSLRAEILNAGEIEKNYTGLEAYYISRGDGSVDPDRSVGILYQRSFFTGNNLKYVRGVPYLEDGELLARVFCLATKCRFSGKPFYVRTTRTGSATNSLMILSDNALDGFLLAANNLIEFQKQNGLTRQQREFLNQPIAKFTLLPFTSLASHFRFIRFVQLISRKEIKNVKLNLHGVYKTYFRYGRVFNRSKLLLFFYILFNVYKRSYFKGY